MCLLHPSIFGIFAVAAVFAACNTDRKTGPREPGAIQTGALSAPTDAHMTMGTATTSTLLGRASFSDPDNQTFNIKRKTGDWDVQIKSKPAFDIAVHSILFQPGAQVARHTHPRTA